MCGIAGFSLSPQSKLPVRQLMHQMLLHSEERGKVASGFGFQVAGRTMFNKNDVPGGQLSLKSFEKAARVGIGHTRNATYGKPEDNDNNHPVLDPKSRIVLVHNGVITNHEAIRTGMPEEVFAEVDSSVLPTLIRDYGAAGLSETDGWAAVAWLDTKTANTLHLARMTGTSPMVIIGLQDGSLLFASTFLIAHAALIDCGLGDQITWAWDMPDHTYVQVKDGSISHMENLRKYSVLTAKFKTKTLSWQEKKRLEAITSGDTTTTVVGTTTTTPVQPKPHTVPGTAYTPRGVTTPPMGGVSTTSFRPSTYESYKPVTAAPFVPPTTDLQLEDPLARMQAVSDAAAKSKAITDSLTVIKQPFTTTFTGGTARSAPLIQVQKQTFPQEVESLLTYWVCYIDEELKQLPASSFDDDSTYDEFVDFITDTVRDGMVKDYGIVGVGGLLVSLWDTKNRAEEEDFILSMLPQLAVEAGFSMLDDTDDVTLPLDDMSPDEYDDWFATRHGGLLNNEKQASFDEVNSFLGMEGMN